MPFVAMTSVLGTETVSPSPARAAGHPLRLPVPQAPESCLARGTPPAASPSAYPYFVSTHLLWMTTDKQRVSPTATVPQIKPRATTKESVSPEAGVEEGAEVISPKGISH